MSPPPFFVVRFLYLLSTHLKLSDSFDSLELGLKCSKIKGEGNKVS